MGDRRIVAVLVAVAVVAFVAAAVVRSGGERRTGGSPPADLPEVLVELADTTAAQGSAAFRFELRVTYPPEYDVTPQTTKGTGYFEFDERNATVRGSTFVEEPERSGPTTEVVKFVRLGDSLYWFPVEAAARDGSGRVREYWFEDDAEAVAKGPSGFPFRELGQSLDLVLRLPSGYVSTPESSDARIAGTSVTKFSGEVDLARAGFLADEFAAVATLQERVIPVDVWVDDDGVARRIGYSLAVQAPLVDGGTGTLDVKVVFDLVELGRDEQVEPPPARDVITPEEYEAFVDEYTQQIDPAPGLPF